MMTFIAFISGAISILAWGFWMKRRDNCSHIWSERSSENQLFRKCLKCEAVELFEPDASGWTAGNWDRVGHEGQR